MRLAQLGHLRTKAPSEYSDHEVGEGARWRMVNVSECAPHQNNSNNVIGGTPRSRKAKDWLMRYPVLELSLTSEMLGLENSSMVRHWPAWVGERNRNHESLRT